MAENIAVNPPTWPATLLRWGGRLLIFGLLLAVLSGPLNRLHITGFTGPLLAFAVGVLLLVLGLVLTAIGYFAGLSRRVAFDKGRSLALALPALLVVGVAVGTLLAARGSPSIHEISTDLESPPSFVAVVPVRAQFGAKNPPEYVRELKNPRGGNTIDVADAQRKAFPDIQPVVLAMPPEQAFARANKAIDELGWEKVAAVPVEGRIEATDTTRFFGFKDDVVVRIRPEGAGARIDIRSKSRVGFGDAGANARRVRALIAKLKA